MRVNGYVRATLIAMGLSVWPLAAAALEPLGVYEDWSGGSIRSDRWQGGQGTPGQEAKRVVTPGHELSMRYRREGSTASNAGNTSASHFLNVTNPATVNELEATFTVADVSMATCAANNAGSTTAARPAGLLIAPFNDGTSPATGNRVGDHLAGVQAFRRGNSADGPGVLVVNGFVNRCTNAGCTTSTTVASSSDLVTKVAVGTPFTLRLTWDQPNHRFLFGLDAGADVPLSYAPATDTAPAVNRFAQIAVSHATANCTAGAVAVDATTRVGTVKANSSAVIP